MLKCKKLSESPVVIFWRNSLELLLLLFGSSASLGPKFGLSLSVKLSEPAMEARWVEISQGVLWERVRGDEL